MQEVEGNFQDLMIDIETLGVGQNALIIQVGACYFDRLTGIIGDKFCKNISIQDGLNKGFSVDGDTIEFWLKQSNRSFLVDTLTTKEVLVSLSRFTKLSSTLWAHATFDFPILANAYRRFYMKLPFHYWATRDIRTLVDLSGIVLPRKSPKKTHNALDDCIYQVSYCVECFKKLRSS